MEYFSSKDLQTKNDFATNLVFLGEVLWKNFEVTGSLFVGCVKLAIETFRIFNCQFRKTFTAKQLLFFSKFRSVM